MSKYIQRKVARLTLIVLFSLFTVQAGSATSLSSQDKQEALKTIADFADQFCQDIPLEGNSENVTLSGDGEVAVNGLISKLVGLEIEGAAKYKSEKYKGVLQADLVQALQASSDCRIHIWDDLHPIILPSPQKRSNGRKNRTIGIP